MEIITGRTGKPHVTSTDDAIRNSFVLNVTKRYVLDVFDKFAYEVIDANNIRIARGYGADQGKMFKADDAEIASIPPGGLGLKRADIIGVRYNKDTDTAIESVALEVISGDPGSTYIDPEYTSENILDGGITDFMPLYRVKLNGLNVEAVEQMFEVVTNVMSLCYPVGAIYMSASPTNPSALFGGTWVAWGAGRVPVGYDASQSEFNAADKIGGEKAHVITTDELPKHAHGFTPSGTVAGAGGHTHNMAGVSVVTNGAHTHSVTGSTDYDGAHTHSSYVDKKFSTGTAQAIRPINIGGSSTMTYTISGGLHHHTISSAKAESAGGHSHSLSGTSQASGAHSHAFTGTVGTTAETGKSTAMSTLQPYVTCYMWKRTA